MVNLSQFREFVIKFFRISPYLLMADILIF